MPVLAAPASGEDAKELYQRASAKYSAPDYESAIELFTAALEKATSEDLSYRVRGAFLFNLAKSHVKAYEEITRDIKNLRSAKAIYTRYLDEADEAQGEYGDTAEATSELERVEQMLEEEEKKLADRAATAATGSGVDADAIRREAELARARERLLEQAGRQKTNGVVLAVVGGIAVGGGIGLVAWGTTFKKFAVREIEDDRTPEQEGEPYSEDEQKYFDSQVRDGRIWMGAGGGLMAVGAAGLGVGIWQLMKSKKTRAEADSIGKPTVLMTPLVAPGFSGLSLSGRF
jgi:tetratricopeptide (TPR) repeat protein